jgi:ABC-type cobalt transport system substrate-binding protein
MNKSSLKGELFPMKKVWKYILSILLVIILATAGTIYYFLNVKTYDTADEEIEEIIESDYEIDLPIIDYTPDSTIEEKGDDTGTNNNADESSTDKDKNTDDINNSEQTTGTDKTTTGSTGSNNPVVNNTGTNPSKNTASGTKQPAKNTSPEETTEITVANIKDLYRPVFQSLESQANGKIDSLLSRAVGEYHAKKAEGATISYSYFYQKYTSAGRDLEAKTDVAFSTIYKALEKDLKKHGYSQSHANDFKEQYAATKKARESALIAKAKEAL